MIRAALMAPVPRAFTLMETMLALGLVVVLAGGVYGFLWDLLGQRDRMDEAMAQSGAANVLVERLEGDLLGSLAAASGEAGIQGTTSSLRLLSRGVPVRVDAPEAAFGDLFGTEVTFDAASGVVGGRRWEGVKGEGAAAEQICGGVQRLRFRYFDGSRWESTFDSAKRNGLPAAIEVAIWFGPPPPLERPETVGERAGDESGTTGAEATPVRTPDRAPDRVRVMVVPDGPGTSWREGT